MPRRQVHPEPLGDGGDFTDGVEQAPVKVAGDLFHIREQCLVPGQCQGTLSGDDFPALRAATICVRSDSNSEIRTRTLSTSALAVVRAAMPDSAASFAAARESAAARIASVIMKSPWSW